MKSMSIFTAVLCMILTMFVVTAKAAVSDFNRDGIMTDYYANWIQMHSKHNKHVLSYSTCKNYARDIMEVSKQEDIDPSILVGIIKIESDFNYRAYNHGAIGLMQVIPFWHKDILKGRSLKNPKVAIEVGAKVFKGYLKKAHMNFRLALMYYRGNHGIEGKKYSNKVLHVAYNVHDNAKLYYDDSVEIAKASKHDYMKLADAFKSVNGINSDAKNHVDNDLAKAKSPVQIGLIVEPLYKELNARYKPIVTSIDWNETIHL